MPPPGFGPGKGVGMPNPRGRVDGERSSEPKAVVTPPATPSRPASVSHGRSHRKRPGDSVVDDNTPNKRRKGDVTTLSPSPLARNHGDFTGSAQRTPANDTPVVIDLRDDTPPPNSSGSKSRVKSTFLDSPRSEAGQATRYSSPLFPSTPTPKGKRKYDYIDLTLDDSDDDSTAPSSKRRRKAAQSGAIDNPFGWTTPKTPVASRGLADHSPQRPEPKYGQARPANTVQKKSTTVSIPVQDRMRSTFGTAFQHDQLTNGSPRASKDMTAPLKSAPAQEGTKDVVLVNRSTFVVHKREADQNLLRRGSKSTDRVVARDLDHGIRKIDGKTKNGDEKTEVDGRVDAGGPERIQSDADPKETEKFSKTDRFKKQKTLLSPPQPSMPARNKPLAIAPSLSGRNLDAAVSVQVHKGYNDGQQGVEKESVGKGDGKTEPSHDDLHVLRSALARARQLREPLDLMVTGQAEKQSELVADDRANGSDERDRRGSTSLCVEFDRREDTRDEQPPRMPRTPRRRKHMIVVLKAPPHELRRISQRPIQRPDIPMGTCFLILMPPEMQEEIFKYLLLADDPIQVLHRWSKLYQRQRSGLHPAILSTCKTIFRNASAFLYGRNVFRYMVRDRPQLEAFPSFGQDINVEKYMPLFRKLELQIERSRTESAYCTSLANAIRLLNDHGASLHTLALDVSPSVEGDTLSTVGYFYQNGELVQALKALRTCFITVRVFTPKTEDEPATSLRRKLDMRTELGPFEEAPAQHPETQLDNLSEMITLACQSASGVVEDGLFEEFEVVVRQNERRARSSRIAYNEWDDDDIGSGDDDDDGDDSSDFDFVG